MNVKVVLKCSLIANVIELPVVKLEKCVRWDINLGIHSMKVEYISEIGRLERNRMEMRFYSVTSFGSKVVFVLNVLYAMYEHVHVSQYGNKKIEMK